MAWITPKVDRRRYMYNEIPTSFHDLYIVRGYRNPNSSVVECIDSLFHFDNNEVMNFWTHFLPLVWLLWTMFGLSHEFDFVNDSRTWPFVVYVLSMCFLLFASSMAHAFNSMSKFKRHVCFIVDYLSLSILSLGVAIGYRSYLYFPEYFHGSFYSRYFILFAVTNAILGALLSCETRMMKRSFLQRFLRLFSFAGPYLYDSVPLISRQFFCTPDTCREPLASQPYLMTHFIFSVSSALVYLSNFPERMFRGTFDIFGYSHQLFHILSGFSVYFQVNGIVIDLRTRADIAYEENQELFETSIGIFGLVICVNIIVVLIKIRQIYFVVHPELEPENNDTCCAMSQNNNLLDKKTG